MRPGATARMLAPCPEAFLESTGCPRRARRRSAQEMAMRRAIVPLALALALATGVVLAEARLIVLAPIAATSVAPSDTTANVATIGRFYDAVNLAIANGQTAEIESLVDAGFVDHVVRPGWSPDRD